MAEVRPNRDGAFRHHQPFMASTMRFQIYGMKPEVLAVDIPTSYELSETPRPRADLKADEGMET